MQRARSACRMLIPTKWTSSGPSHPASNISPAIIKAGSFPVTGNPPPTMALRRRSYTIKEINIGLWECKLRMHPTIERDSCRVKSNVEREAYHSIGESPYPKILWGRRLHIKLIRQIKRMPRELQVEKKGPPNPKAGPISILPARLPYYSMGWIKHPWLPLPHYYG